MAENLLETKLWQHVEQIASKNDNLFKMQLQILCQNALDLSTNVKTFLPNFTLHNSKHLLNVCEWMANLLDERVNELTLEEAALLLITACWHDIGMCVSNKQIESIKASAKDYLGFWADYFSAKPAIDTQYHQTHIVPDSMLRDYVRLYHHRRVKEQLYEFINPADFDELIKHGITFDLIADVCCSHGEDLEKISVPTGDSKRLLSIVLLRLADLFDYSEDRAPIVVFKFLGLDDPQTEEEEISSLEFIKNQSGRFYFDRSDPDQECVLKYNAISSDPNLEDKLTNYVRWAEHELDQAHVFLQKFKTKWRNLVLPRKIVDDYERAGYEQGDFCLNINQTKVIKLLAGNNLYDNPNVFVRELLQNSIDTVLHRRGLEDHFDGRISIQYWTESDGYGWFRIRDNGMGMDERIIKEYFLTVGHSYYNSDEFLRDQDQIQRYHSDRSFAPISRFGIGILSCFMNDENAQIEVVTRHYSENRKPHPVLQLFVTGLRGKYKLVKLDAEKSIPSPIHTPPFSKWNDNVCQHPVGTTITVRVDAFIADDILKVVRKYICHPEVAIDFQDSKCTEKFTTLMDIQNALHELSQINPEMIFSHPIHIPEPSAGNLLRWKWSDGIPPTLDIHYISHEMHSFGNHIKGFTFSYRLNSLLKVEPIVVDNMKVFLDVVFLYDLTHLAIFLHPLIDHFEYILPDGSVTTHDKSEIISLLGIQKMKDDLGHSIFTKLRENLNSFDLSKLESYLSEYGYKSCHQFRNDLYKLLVFNIACSYQEKICDEPYYPIDIGQLRISLHNIKTTLFPAEEILLDDFLHDTTLVLKASYSGVLIENSLSNTFISDKFHDCFICQLLLFTGNRGPVVDVSRSSCISLPFDLNLECACLHIHLYKEIGFSVLSMIYGLLDTISCMTLREAELCKKTFQLWFDYRKNRYINSTNKQDCSDIYCLTFFPFSQANKLSDIIDLISLKLMYKVSVGYDYKQDKSSIDIWHKKSELSEALLDFPAIIFSFRKENFIVVKNGSFKSPFYYHSAFCQWLCEYHAFLKYRYCHAYEQILFYCRMINAPSSSRSIKDDCKSIITILQHLQGISSSGFSVSNDVIDEFKSLLANIEAADKQ